MPKNKWFPVRVCDGCSEIQLCLRIETHRHDVYYYCPFCLENFAREVQKGRLPARELKSSGWFPIRPCDNCGAFRLVSKIEVPSNHEIIFLCSKCLSVFQKNMCEWEKEHALTLSREALRLEREMLEWEEQREAARQ